MKRLIVLLVAVAALVAFAGAFVPSDAATVGQTSISRQALDSDLSAIAGSPYYVCFRSEERELSSGAKIAFLGAGSASAKGGVYDATFVDDWLGSMITNQVTARLVAKSGMRVTAYDLTIARGLLTSDITDVLDTYAQEAELPSPACGGSGKAVLASLPRWFVVEQTTAEADQALLDARAAGTSLSTGAIDAYFTQHRVSFDKVCLDVIVVSTGSAAEKVEASLAKGVSFAAEAQAASITQTSAASGGSVGCGHLTKASSLVPVIDKMAVGAVTPPLSDNGKYLVLKLASRPSVSFSTARPTVVPAIIEAGQTRADAELANRLRSSLIGIDPRYGSTVRHSLTLVLPAPSPPASAEISTSANLPTLTAAVNSSS